MSVSDLFERLQALPIGLPMDLPKICADIRAEFECARTTAEREALLTIFIATMDCAERQIKTQDSKEFKDTRRKYYRLLLIREAAMPDGNIDPQKIEEITRREVEAGRMTSDDDFRQNAAAGAAVFARPRDVQYPTECREYAEMVRAHLAQITTQSTEPTLLMRLRQKLATVKLVAATAKWRASPVGQALQKYTDNYVSNNTVLGSHSADYKQKLITELYDGVATIYGADNPFLKCREILAGHVDSYADWAVQALKPEEKLQLGEDDPRNSPYISGELQSSIRYCAQYNGELANLISKHRNIADEELISWANARSCAYQYLMNGINTVRADVNDIDLTRRIDWFRPFVRSMLISKENAYRNKIGLPALLPVGAVNLSWQHSSFSTLVMNGHRDPLSRWEAIHKLVHSDVS